MKTGHNSLFFLFLQFSKETIANMYSAYIDNFLNAKDAVRTAKEAKPAFHKFLEVSVIIKSWLGSEGRTFLLCIKKVIIGGLPVALLTPVEHRQGFCSSTTAPSCGIDKVQHPSLRVSRLFILVFFTPFKNYFIFLLQQQSMRENKEKQALGDLMIKPVQRIPRYELLVKVNYLQYNQTASFHVIL